MLNTNKQKNALVAALAETSIALNSEKAVQTTKLAGHFNLSLFFYLKVDIFNIWIIEYFIFQNDFRANRT